MSPPPPFQFLCLRNVATTFLIIYYLLIFIALAAWQKQEGDITYLTDKFLFPEDLDDPFFERPTTDSAQRSKRAAVRNRYKLWKNGVVPYILSDNYTGS